MTVPSYVDLDSVQRPTNGAQALPAWGDQVNDDMKHLYYTTSELVSVEGTGAVLGTNKIYEQVGFSHLGASAYSAAPGFGSGSNYGYLTVPFPNPFPTGFVAAITNGIYVIPASGNQYVVPCTVTGGSTTEVVFCFGPYTLTSGDTYQAQWIAKGY